ncbi:ABC transporter permease [Mesoplasma tabanidae]|nr:ABC transporter permease [Mesoplasma tabanidae]
MFKFKIQFIVVILLSFFASFYLASTTSLNSRMNRSYDDIVRSYEKFDYSYSTKASESNLSTSSKTLLPILDLIPNSTNYFKQNNKIIHDSFNVVLNDHGFTENGYNENIITKTFFENQKPTNTIKDIWNLKNEWTWGRMSVVESDPFKGTFDYVSQNYQTNFGSNIDKYSGADYFNTFSSFTYLIVKALSETLYNELKNDSPDESFANSLIYKYWKENDYKVDKNFKSIKLESFNKEDMHSTLWYDEYKKQVSSLGEFQVYVYNALETVAYFITYQINQFLTNSYSRTTKHMSSFDWSTAGNNDVEKTTRYVKEFNTIADKNKEMKIFVKLQLPNQGEQTITGGDLTSEQIWNYNKELTFEYIFGAPLEENEKINSDFIVGDISTTYQLKANDSNIIASKLKVENNGLRGLANPVTVAMDESINEYSFSTINLLNPWEKNNLGEKWENQNTGKKYSYEFDSNKYKTMYDWANIYSHNVFHQTMAAEVNEIELYLREEAFMYDRTSKTNFRFVILDDNYDYNFKVTAGLPVMQSNEIVISQQYAFKNGYSVGDAIKIGNSNFIISGFGSDALTYYPLVDPEIPLSDVANSVIVYAPKYIVEKVMKDGSEKDLSFTTYYFIKDALKEKETLSKRMSIYDSVLFSNKSKLSESFEDSQNDSLNFGDKKSINEIKNFEKTYFNLNWTLQPKMLEIVTIVSIVTSILVLLMSFVSIIFGIKKTIDHNSNQIGFLKAKGVDSYRLSLSYIVYSIILFFIVVPLAWLSAGFFQEIITKLFATYFSTTLYEFVFDYKILLVLLILFGIGSLILSYLIAFILVSKDVLKIINKESQQGKARNWLPRKLNIINIMDFKFRFPLKIALRGSKQIAMISVTVLITAFVITISILTPSMLNVYIRDAGKYYTYNNQYIMNDELTGLPTAKTSLTASRGLPTTESLYQEPKTLLGTSSRDQISDIYFDNNKYYVDSSWDSNMFPPILMGEGWTNGEWKTDLNWTEKWFFDDKVKTKDDTSKLLKMAMPVIGQLGNLNGITISAGSFEKLASYVWNTDINPNTGYSYFHNQAINETTKRNVWEMKKNSAKGSIEFIQMALQIAMEALAQSNDESGLPTIERPNDTTWKEDLILLALAFLPNVGQQYLKDSPNRASQFGISINAENYTPGIETLSTDVQTKINNNVVNINGLKDNQTVYNLDSINDEKVFIKDQETLNKLNLLFNDKENYNGGDIKLSTGFKVYDSNSKVLTVPVVTNLKSVKQQGLNNKVNIQGMNYKTLSIGGKTLPKNAWVYDNREITANKKLFSKDFNMQNEADWINPSSIDPSKLTYSKQFEYDNDGNITAINDQSKWFINSLISDQYDINGLDFELRPYYHYNNLKLFVPKNITDIDSLLNGKYANTNKTSKNSASDWRSNIDIWHGTVQQRDIPEEVKKAWGTEFANEQEWEWISPFSLNYSKKITDPNRKGWIQSIDTDLQQIYTWASDKIVSSGSSSEAVISTSDALPSFLNGVNMQSVDTIETYNGNIIIADQDILNLLTNKSTEKYLPVDYDFYGEAIAEVPDGKITNGDHTITMNHMRTPIEQLNMMREHKNFYMKNDLIEKYKINDQEAYRKVLQNRDFNSKFSAFDEAFGVTGGIKGTMVDSPGVFALQGSSKSIESNLGMSYNKVDLVSTQLGMIISISESILLVALFLITGVIIISILVITIISDVYIMKYHRFMVTMKALGYSNKEVVVNTILIPSIIATVFVITGYIIGKWLLGVLMVEAQKFGVFIPLITNWWATPVILLGILLMFIIAFIFSLRKPLKDELKSLT